MCFSFYYFKQPANLLEQVFLPALTLLSSFGSPTAAVSSVAFLSAWLNISNDSTELFVETLTMTRYFQVIVTVVGFNFVPILVIFAFYGKLKLKLSRLIPSLAFPFLIFGIITFGLFHLEGWLIPKRLNSYLTLSLPTSITSGVDVTIHNTPETVRSHNQNETLNETTLDRIKRTGVLRVGYNVFPIPFCYLNNKGELVGYDIAFAYELVRSLNVKLVLIPFTWNNLVEDLKASRFDIAMAGIYVTNERIESVKVSKSYFKSPLVMIDPSNQAGKFLSREKIEEIQDLKIAIFNDQVFLDLVNETFPEAETKLVSNLEEMVQFKDYDAIIWTLTQGSILASINTDLSVVIPKDLGPPFLFAYLMPPNSSELREYVNYWLDLKEADGFTKSMNDYWILGKPQEDGSPRWSVIRNVLHWVD